MGFEFDIGVMAASVSESERVCESSWASRVGWAEQNRADGKGLVAVGERKKYISSSLEEVARGKGVMEESVNS